MTQNTMKVIQHLEIIDVPTTYVLCDVCGEHKDRKETDRIGRWPHAICHTCKALPEDTKTVMTAAFNKERQCGKYYTLASTLGLYNSISEHITVAELIEQLKGLDPDARLTLYYDDPDNGQVNINPSFSSPEKQSILGLNYYEA